MNRLQNAKLIVKICYFYFGLDTCQDACNFMGNLAKKIKSTTYLKMATNGN